jgi:DnaK suppressor protein
METENKERTRYNDAELQEFKELILKKLESARAELKDLSESANNSNGTDDTGSVYKTMEDGSSTLLKESNSQLAGRQLKFISNLEMALLRIENKTYGICKVTGKLIPKERLYAVPHTTQSMEAKLKQYK